ncbi:MAG: peptidoglycan DD-metalloendopeptidase family protein [Lentimicrobiaceae bacterium]|nr:peptidoglycan DD-metalloendopeptidase family protein [Lentimicrobiaceae bacterium]
MLLRLLYKNKVIGIIFCILPLFSFAQQVFVDIDEQAQNRIMEKPVEICDSYTHFNPEQVNKIDNERQIPAFSLYNNLWDTLFIRSEKIEIPFFDNQLKIILIQEGNNSFAFPVSEVVSTGYVKNKNRQHTGIDFSVSKKEPVVACFDGVVRIVKKYEEYGNTVVVRHYNGLETLYAQLDEVNATTNQKVKAGEVIGYVSNTNSNKNKNTHFEIRFLNEFFNPEKVINFQERKLHNNLLILTPTDFIFIPVEKSISVIKREEINPNSSSEKLLLDTPKTMPVFHTVQSGETIYRICTKYNITEQQLRSLNNIKGDHITVGQKLRIK